MTERVTFVMRALDAYQQATACLTSPRAFRASDMHPLSLDVGLQRPDGDPSHDDHEMDIQVKHPGRALAGPQELMSDA
jgi:hypothetical protein